jgi:hypothetical protein
LVHETSKARESCVLLGVAGWEWPHWDGSFYPSDMPPEWRLAYYNTQFPCVFVPKTQWLGESAETLGQWHEDTHSGFLFLLECSPGATVPKALGEKARCVSAHDGGITWFDRHTDIKALAAALVQETCGVRYVLSRDGDLAQLERVRTLLVLLGLMT